MSSQCPQVFRAVLQVWSGPGREIRNGLRCPSSCRSSTSERRATWRRWDRDCEWGGGSILWRPLTYGKYQLCKETCQINAPGFSKVKWGRLSKVNWGYCYTAAEAPIRMLLYHYIACVTALLLLLDSDHVLVSETANWTSQWNVVERQAQPLKCDWLVGITTSVRANWTMMNL